MKRLLQTLVLVSLACNLIISNPLGQDKTKVVLDPSFSGGQVSNQTLTFMIPNDWSVDKEAAKKMGVWAVLLPKGSKIENTERVITINFEKKDQKVPAHHNLESYLKASFDQAKARFPDLQVNKWQPSELAASGLNFLSQELATENPQFTPNHLLIIDSGDGYFTIALAAQDVKELNQIQYEEFFNSLRFIPILELPAPPEGYSWKKLEGIKAAILMPSGWHYKKEPEKAAYFLTKEDIEKEGRYKTGLTIQALQVKEAGAAKEFAKSMIAVYSQKNNRLIRSWETTKGIYKNYGWQSKVSLPENEATIVYGLLITNTKTNTIYYCLYESYESTWEEAWKTGEKMIQTMILNDSM